MHGHFLEHGLSSEQRRPGKWPHPEGRGGVGGGGPRLRTLTRLGSLHPTSVSRSGIGLTDKTLQQQTAIDPSPFQGGNNSRKAEGSLGPKQRRTSSSTTPPGGPCQADLRFVPEGTKAHQARPCPR